MTKAWFMLATAIASNVIANIAFKRAVMDVVIKPEWSTLYSLISRPWFWLGVLACTSLMGSYLYAIKYIQLEITYALVTSGALVMITVLSGVLFGAQLGITKIIGIALIMLGVWLLVITTP